MQSLKAAVTMVMAGHSGSPLCFIISASFSLGSISSPSTTNIAVSTLLLPEPGERYPGGLSGPQVHPSPWLRGSPREMPELEVFLLGTGVVPGKCPDR